MELDPTSFCLGAVVTLIIIVVAMAIIVHNEEINERYRH
jgi:hypothetical protein